MNKQKIQEKVSELLDLLNTTKSESNLEKQKNQSLPSCWKKLKISRINILESFDKIRQLMRYIIFDLEATRRENAYLKKLVKENKEK